MTPKILHCVYSGLGGHAAVCFSLLESRAMTRYAHHILFFGVEDLSPDYATRCAALGVSFEIVKKRRGVDFRSSRLVLKHIRRVCPNIVLINGSALAPIVLAARSTIFRNQRLRVVVRESQSNDLKTYREWAISLLIAQVADAVVYQSEEYRREVESRFRRATKNSSVINNGIDPSRFTPRRDNSSKALQLAMVSRIVPIKDHKTLIAALRILVHDRGLSDLHLTIVGDGPCLQGLKKLSADSNLEDHVTFTGALTKKAVDELLAVVHIYAHCTFGEGMSNSILEAMAASLPIVASDVKGVHNMLRDESDAILVPVAEPTLLADAIGRLVNSPELRSQLGSRARRRIELEFSQERMAERYAELFESLY